MQGGAPMGITAYPKDDYKVVGPGGLLVWEAVIAGDVSFSCAPRSLHRPSLAIISAARSLDRSWAP